MVHRATRQIEMLPYRLDGQTARAVRAKFWIRLDNDHWDARFPDVTEDEDRALAEFELDVIAEVLRHRGLVCCGQCEDREAPQHQERGEYPEEDGRASPEAARTEHAPGPPTTSALTVAERSRTGDPGAAAQPQGEQQQNG